MSRIVAPAQRGRDALVALFEIGADTTSLKVLRDDEQLYDRDQAFGGVAADAADLAPVRFLVRGSRAEEAGRRPARGLRDHHPGALRRQPVAGDRPRAAVLLHQHAAPQGALRDAGRRHRHAAGLKDRVTDLTGFASMVVNPFDNMQLGSAVRETACAARRRPTSRPAAWRCGGSCSDPDQPAAAPRGQAQAAQAGVLRPASAAAAVVGPGRSRVWYLVLQQMMPTSRRAASS
jgi:hypothetical protein